MPYAERTRQCWKCHKPFTGRIAPKGPVYCVPCKIDNASDAAIQMANKEGPYYDRWLASGGPQGRPPLPSDP